jgi:hypothetical protein
MKQMILGRMHLVESINSFTSEIDHEIHIQLQFAASRSFMVSDLV